MGDSKFGVNALNNVMFGASQVSKLMFGTEEIWANAKMYILVTASYSGFYKSFSADNPSWSEHIMYSWPYIDKWEGASISDNGKYAVVFTNDYSPSYARIINLETNSIITTFNAQTYGSPFDADKQFSGAIFVDNDQYLLLFQRYGPVRIRVSDWTPISSANGANFSIVTRLYKDPAGDNNYITDQLGERWHISTLVDYYAVYEKDILCVDSQGNYYVADLSGNLKKYSSNNTLLWSVYYAVGVPRHSRKGAWLDETESNIYIGIAYNVGKGILAKVDISNGQPSGTTVWQCGIAVNKGDTLTSFEYKNGRLFAAGNSSNQAGFFCEINVDTGNVIWEIDSPIATGSNTTGFYCILPFVK